MSVLSKLDFKFEKIDLKWNTQLSIGVSLVTSLLTLRYMLKSDIPTIYYPRSKDKRFIAITERTKESNLPKVFWAKGFFPFNLSQLLVIGDFDVMQRAFKNPVVSDRINTTK